MTVCGIALHSIAKQKEARTMPAAHKTMGTVFLDAERLQVFPQEETTNAACYCHMLPKLRLALCDKCQGKEKSIMKGDIACLCGEDSEEWLGTSPSSTLQSRHNRLPSDRVHERSDMRPALSGQLGSPGSSLSYELPKWSSAAGVLHTSVMVAENVSIVMGIF
jgi:hypothetical protein